MDDDPLDLGEAAAFILGERPALAEDTVWTVLNELQDPPVRNADGMAPPTLLTTMSIWPNSAMAVSTSVCIPSRVERSPATVAARRP